MHHLLNDCLLQPEKHDYPEDWEPKLVALYQKLNLELSKDDKFLSFDFCDVSAGGIQIRLICKEVPGYTIGNQFTLFYDLSNIDHAFDEVMENWKEASTDQNIKSFKEFIADGEKYGWD